MWLWAGMVILRLGWAVWPQTGYIHPDEFFQTVEVIAGDSFNISVERTWEFEPSFPLRSMVLPRLIFSPMYKTLSIANESFPDFQLSGNSVLSGSRIVMASLSTWIDLCVYVICSKMNLQCYSAALLLASSYVMLTYQTHSFTNSVESLLLITVLLLIIKSVQKNLNINISNQTLKQMHSKLEKSKSGMTSPSALGKTTFSGFDGKHSAASRATRNRKKINNTTSRADIMKGLPNKKFRTASSGDNVCYLDVVILAVTNVAGIFNRPTFVAFSIVPFCWWLHKRSSNRTLLVKTVFVFITVSFVTAAVFGVLDTCYYHRLSVVDVLTWVNWEWLKDNFVFTPLNFVLYNTAFDNLEKHGQHPFYLHGLVNMPLLFGPLIIYIVSDIFVSIFSLFSAGDKNVDNKKKDSGSETNISQNVRVAKDSLHVPVLGFILTPVLVLSVIPHQEPRFLIPLLPLVIIHAVSTAKQFGKLFISSFIVFNIVLSTVYGVLHQGGITPCLTHLQKLSNRQIAANSSLSINIIFSHTYMPPKHLLLLNKRTNINLIDLKGSNFDVVHDIIVDIGNRSDKRQSNDAKTNESVLYLAMPGTVIEHFVAEHWGSFSFTVIEMFSPHLSLEDPPQLASVSGLRQLNDQLSLYLIQVDMM